MQDCEFTARAAVWLDATRHADIQVSDSDHENC